MKGPEKNPKSTPPTEPKQESGSQDTSPIRTGYSGAESQIELPMPRPIEGMSHDDLNLFVSVDPSATVPNEERLGGVAKEMSPMSKGNPRQIRNSTAEFLIFTKQAGEKSLEVMVEGESVWLTQKQMAALFDVSVPAINQHLSNLYEQGEIERGATVKDFLIVQKEGSREVSRNVDFYKLDAIIAVGFRVNSSRAIQFRQWAAGVIRDFSVRGYILDKERLKNGAFLTKDYFDNLLAEIREIRASERKFYQRITDIYSTAMDYNKDAEVTKAFFATVQNRLHFAIHGHTAAEVIVKRADSTKEHMGLATWKNAPQGKILKPDVSVAKNYLTKPEINALDLIVGMYLDYAESQATKGIPMTMEDWSSKLNAFLRFNEHEILSGAGTVTKEIAKAFAESEFEKYRVIQDRLFESDFDRLIKKDLEE